MAKRLNVPDVIAREWLEDGTLKYTCPIPLRIKFLSQDWSELLHMSTANQDLTINSQNKDYLERKQTFELFQDIETYYVTVERRADHLKKEQEKHSSNTINKGL